MNRCCIVLYTSGMPTGSHKKRGTTFCGKLDGELTLSVRSFKDPPPYTVRNYLLGFRRISEVNILVGKKRISTVWRKIGIPDTCVTHLYMVLAQETVTFGAEPEHPEPRPISSCDPTFCDVIDLSWRGFPRRTTRFGHRSCLDWYGVFGNKWK